MTRAGAAPRSVADELQHIGLVRVVHFTPAINLHHIISDGQIRPTAELANLAPEYFAPTDPVRLDAHTELTCVTFTYPNPFYFETARGKDEFKRFPDWVCLYIDARVLARNGTLFAPCNAAKAGGAYLMAGAGGLARCYAAHTLSGYDRSPSHHPLCATDLQAEALVPGPILLSEVTAIATPTTEAARNGYARLDAADLKPDRLSWIVSPVAFKKWPLVNAIQQGQPILERAWSPEEGTH